MDEQDMGETPAGAAGSSAIDAGGLGGAEGASAGAVSRVQNLVHLVPVDWSGVGSLIGPLLDRVDAESDETQLLVLTDDPVQALAVSESVFASGAGAGGGRGGMFPVSSVKRAARLFAERAPSAVACSVSDAKALIASSALKLDGLRTLVLAWPHETLATSDASAALESVMAEIPKGAARLVLAATSSAPLESFLERYMRRARRVEERPTEPALQHAVEFLSIGSKGRGAALRTVLDEVDPASVVVRVAAPGAMKEAADFIAMLGLGARESVQLLAEGTEGSAELVVLYDFPSSRDALASIFESGNHRVIALVEPRELAALRRMAGDQARVYASPAMPRKARSRQAALLAELVDRLASERFDGEVLALEPVLESHEAVEVASALFRMLADERVRTEVRSAEKAARTPERAPEVRAAHSTPGTPHDSSDSGEPLEWTRVFINVGERDGASPGDLLGAITGEAGVKRDVIGRIDFRDRFSIVEISSSVVEQVIERITGATIRGRQVNAREDRGPGERSHGGRPLHGRSEEGRGPRGFERGGRGDGAKRGFDRGNRRREGPAERSGSPARGFDRGPRDRSDRPTRDFDRGGSERGGSGAGSRPASGRGGFGGPRGVGGAGGAGGGRGGAGGGAGRNENRFGGRDSRGSGRSFDGPGRGQGAGRGAGDRSGRPGPGGGGGGGGGGANRERDRGYGRTQDDERMEWRLRGERLRRSRSGSGEPPARREGPES